MNILLWNKQINFYEECSTRNINVEKAIFTSLHRAIYLFIPLINVQSGLFVVPILLSMSGPGWVSRKSYIRFAWTFWLNLHFRIYSLNRRLKTNIDQKIGKIRMQHCQQPALPFHMLKREREPELSSAIDDAEVNSDYFRVHGWHDSLSWSYSFKEFWCGTTICSIFLYFFISVIRWNCNLQAIQSIQIYSVLRKELRFFLIET